MIEKDGQMFDEFGNFIPNFLINIDSESANVYETSFVSNPATERNFMAFSEPLKKQIVAKYSHLPKDILIDLKNVQRFSEQHLELFYKRIVEFNTKEAFGKMPVDSFKVEQKRNKSKSDAQIFELGRALQHSNEQYMSVLKEQNKQANINQTIVYMDEVVKEQNKIVEIYKNEKYGFDYSEMFYKIK